MSAIAIGASIPTNIVTAEQLAVWVGLLLNYINPTLSTLESSNNPQKQFQTLLFEGADNNQYLNLRMTIKLDPTYVSDRSVKLWMKAMEASNVAVPAAFSSN